MPSVYAPRDSMVGIEPIATPVMDFNMCEQFPAMILMQTDNNSTGRVAVHALFPIAAALLTVWAALDAGL